MAKEAVRIGEPLFCVMRHNNLLGQRLRTGVGLSFSYAQERQYMAREFSKAFYNSKEWAQVREAVMMRDKYLCQHCGKPATEVHHIIHLSPENIGDMSIALNMDNLVALCRDCHFEEHRGEHGNGRTKEEQYDYEFNENGMLVRKKNDSAPV